MRYTDDMSHFWLAFVPLFVAVDAMGTLPMFLSLTSGLPREELRPLVLRSVATATAVALVFILGGPALLSFLGITVPDFMISGGILLLVISLSDLLTGEKRARASASTDPGPVPIGVPLITGPAVLTTCILLTRLHGAWITTAAALANILLAGAIFLASGAVARILGHAGTRILSKVASLLLASIAVMLIRRGVTELLGY